MTTRFSGWACGGLLAVASWALPAAAQPAGDRPASGCQRCHAGLADARLAAPAQRFAEDVHHDRRFTCVECHGGDPAATDAARAKDPARGYRGVPRGAAVIATCVRCHSDAEFMRRYAPRQRVDQAAEYATSVHGQRLQTGDDRVATCASCHGAHGIRQVSDAKSPVFPLNVAATCARCHADAEHMKPYTASDGSPLPTTQRDEYEQSVHFQALTRRKDLSAPTCNDCHGNHGAAPPGVGAVANVCGTCHAVFAVRFERSVHREIFPRGCVECHGNHAVEPSADDMLGTGDGAVCAICHSQGDNGFTAAGAMRARVDHLKGRIDRAAGLLARVANAGMEVSDQELALGEARNHLTLVRTEIHATSPATVEPIVQEGDKILDAIERAGAAALAELRFRRQGLAVSLAAILLVVVALAFKIRELDRRAGLKPR